MAFADAAAAHYRLGSLSSSLSINSSSNSKSTSGIEEPPSWHKVVGICLALGSALFIGASFVIKKRGLLDANKEDGKRPGEGYGYLKSSLWWTGMLMSEFFEI
jgi:hypothetical protein